MKIIIYGTGKIAKKIIEEEFIDINQVDSFVESEKTKDEWLGKKVYSLDDMIEKKSFDVLVIAIQRADDVYRRCIEKEIDSKKILLMFPLKNSICCDVRSNFKLGQKLLSIEGNEFLYQNFGVITYDWIKEDELKYSQLNTREEMEVNANYRYYIYSDKNDKAGKIGSYFWQDLWAAKKIKEMNPKKHFDIGSRIDGFIAHLLVCGIDVTMIDIRPLETEIKGLNFINDDATKLNNIEDDSIESISALCSLEHFGLGRYGDSIDPEACYKCFDAIQRKVKKGGYIYISVPIGKEHLEFNAQRVFSIKTIIKEFDRCELKEFSCADNTFEENVLLDKYNNDLNLGGNRFGLFWFQKRNN